MRITNFIENVVMSVKNANTHKHTPHKLNSPNYKDSIFFPIIQQCEVLIFKIVINKNIYNSL